MKIPIERDAHGVVSGLSRPTNADVRANIPWKCTVKGDPIAEFNENVYVVSPDASLIAYMSTSPPNKTCTARIMGLNAEAHSSGECALNQNEPHEAVVRFATTGSSTVLIVRHKHTLKSIPINSAYFQTADGKPCPFIDPDPILEKVGTFVRLEPGST